jgi:hypothetical protein
MNAVFAAVLRFALLAVAWPATAADRAYWVWHRPEPLTETESTELRAQGVATLYWHVATIGKDFAVTRRAPDPAKLAPGFRIVPVVRVETGTLPPPAEFTKLSRFALEDALQLDFDCRDRQLGDYAARLTELRAKVPHLGITALAHWPAVKEFPALARSVEEICPMFYDLQNDPTGVSAETPPPPLLDPAPVEKLLAGWHNCPTKWRAGLPAFSRLTLFDDSGVSRGQLPAWEWDELVFNPHLHTLAPTKLGVTLLRADAGTLISRRPVRAGELLAVRTTDRAALTASIAAAEKAGSAGVVFFRLPGESGTAHSLRALGHSADARPQCTLRREGGALILRNQGDADLGPRLSGERHDRDRGCELELDAPAPIFREAEPGAFFRVGAHVDADRTPRPAQVATATRLTFWFSRLPAGASLRSGLFQLAPAADVSRLRWRVMGGEWQPLTSQ